MTEPFLKLMQALVVDQADHIYSRLERVNACSFPDSMLGQLRSRLKLVNEVAQVCAALSNAGVIGASDLAVCWWIIRDQYLRLSRNEQIDHSKLAAVRHRLQELVRCV